jgi:hypothetical protein
LTHPQRGLPVTPWVKALRRERILYDGGQSFFERAEIDLSW